MRTIRRTSKRCGRLGYNATIVDRRVGSKKKWERLGNVIKKKGNTEQRTNHVRIGKEKRIGGKGKKLVRRKERHGKKLNERAGRKGRYGNRKREHRRTGLLKQREKYKRAKQEVDHRYRKGLSSVVQKEGGKEENRRVHRRSGMERRVDVRRWRSGRVRTRDKGRDRVEHGYVKHVKQGERGERVKWQGEKVQVGNGRKVEEMVWYKDKEKEDRKLKGKEVVKYREVDYVTGRRRVVRKPYEEEVIIPKGLERTRDTFNK